MTRVEPHNKNRDAFSARYGVRTIFLVLSLLGSLVILPQAIADEERGDPLNVEGLNAPVEILIDRWGVAHIYAENEADLFFTQGYHAASQRLFQFELWRRQATGTVAEVLGRRELERDIGARLLRFRGELRRELNHYHSRGEAIITSFTRGINAWIDQTRRQPELLPIEFRMLGWQPGHWTPEIVVSRHQGLMYNLTQELGLGRAVAMLGAEQVKQLMWFHPGDPDLTLDAAIDGQRLSADVLTRYNKARSPIEFKHEDVVPEFRIAARHDSQGRSRTVPNRGEFPLHLSTAAPAPFDLRDIGSNNWVISGRRSETGSTMLANDPHRVVTVPSLRYFVHLVGPGWNVIGGGEPTLPGVSIGHNEHGAWGLTIFRIDAEDLYVYETHPDDPSRYRFGDGWEPMRVERESFAIRGEAAIEVDLKFTRHGPVLFEDHERRVAFALRAGWLDVGGAPYLASLRMNGARDWAEFRAACGYNHMPGENMVWADRAGNIGWQAVGIAPRRPNWSGLVPVPGDGRFEWNGYLPIHDLPHVFNPTQGFWNTSNENLIPDGYPHRPHVGWTWADPYRGARVREVLDSGRRLNAMDMMRLQQDELSIPARTLVPLLRDLPIEADNVRQASRRMQDWDFVLDRDSVAAGIYAMWERQLADKIEKRFVPKAVRPHLGSLSMKRMIDWILMPDGRFGDDPLAARDTLLIDSLVEAVAELEKRFGPNMDRWQYGQPQYKHALVRHPLSAAVKPEWQAKFDVGPLPRGGNSYTVNNTGNADNQPSGGTFRVIIDTGDWDTALATNSPGQSGDPDAAHYRDLFRPWAQGRYFPLFYSRAKIESVRERVIHLAPRDGANRSSRVPYDRDGDRSR
jgi:penicillin amidase